MSGDPGITGPTDAQVEGRGLLILLGWGLQWV